MAETILVSGHKNPDNDAISAAVGYAWLKNEVAKRSANGGEPDVVYKPVRLGPLPPETSWVLEQGGIEAPELIDHVEPGQKIILVDHNETRQAVDGLADAQLVEIIDHHRIGDVSTVVPIKFLNLPLGSSCTIVTLEACRLGVGIPASIARVLLSAVLTDTVILKSPTATDVDREQVAFLSEIVGVDPTEFGLAIFRTRGGEEGIPIEKFVCADSKEFPVEGGVALIAQHETVDLESALKREDEARAYMDGLVAEKGYKFVLLLVTDILAEGSQFICQGDRSIVNKAFGIDCTGKGGTWMPGVLSRKKQVAPKVVAN